MRAMKNECVKRTKNKKGMERLCYKSHKKQKIKWSFN